MNATDNALAEAILFEDNHVLVINKPAGLSTLPNEGMEDCETIYKAFIKERDAKPGNVFLTPVHRVDRGVSGILVFAKTSKALSRLNEQIRDRVWKKIYVAEVEKPLPEDEGTLVHHLCKRQFYADVYSSPRKFSKEAKLSYKHVKSTIYQIQLHTGRYHQIRAQLGFMKSAIKGDLKYGGKKTRLGRIHLHHAQLTFLHPITKEKVVIDSKPPFM